MTKKHVTIICPSCTTKNTLKKNQLLDLKTSPECETCQSDLLEYFSKPLLELSENAFIHDLDRQMLEALRKVPGVDTILRSLLRHSLELSMRLHHQGNFIKVSDKQLKSLYDKLKLAAHHLDMGVLPELYVVQDSRVNAYTFGVEKCSIAVSAGLLDLMSGDEITCILAHELGHIKANHVLYKTASRLLLTLADSIAHKTFGLGGIVLYPVQLALLRWDRASELSSDRAALLVVKNPMVVLNTMMKLAGGTSTLVSELNIKAFIDQAEGYEKTQDEGPLGKYIAVMNSMFNTHPFPIWRAREIIDWVSNGDYFKILQGNFQKSIKIGPHACPRCGQEVMGEIFCDHCRQDSDQKQAYGEKIDKALDSLRSWYDKNFNLPK